MIDHTEGEAIEPPFDDTSDLNEEIRSLRGQLSAHAEVMRKMNFRSRMTHVLAVLLCLGMGIALWLVVEARHAAQDADRAADEAQATAISAAAAVEEVIQVRTDARIVACRNENILVFKIREGIADSLLALVPLGTTLTPEQQGRVDRYRQSLIDEFPYRDCSEEGVRKYFENLPPDPAVSSP